MAGRIVVYSRSGTTARLAEDLAGRLGCEISRIDPGRYGWPVLGYMRAGRDSLREYRPAITVTPPVQGADWLVIGSPIWTSYLSTPLRSLVDQRADLPPILGVFTTSGGVDEQKNVPLQIDGIGAAGAIPPWLSLTTKTHGTEAGEDKIAAFVAQLQSQIASIPPGG
ncbi:hypothetical protein V8J82_13435 [Gymnodinialimonas sp. 2305UL16-5]|uniref:flavodoxin family protein n=1 Tax=Gymnodinialimonas mytili TaxID=3126503 RepID=UPI0030A0A7E1